MAKTRQRAGTERRLEPVPRLDEFFPCDGIWLVHRDSGSCMSFLADVPDPVKLAAFYQRVGDVAAAINQTDVFRILVVQLLNIACAARDEEYEQAKRLADELPDRVWWESNYDIAKTICQYLAGVDVVMQQNDKE